MGDWPMKVAAVLARALLNLELKSIVKGAPNRPVIFGRRNRGVLRPAPRRVASLYRHAVGEYEDFAAILRRALDRQPAIPSLLERSAL